MKTGRKLRDFTGQRFGSYLVLRRGPNRYPRIKNGYKQFQTTWVCRCDCGHQAIRSSQQVKSVKQCLDCHNRLKALPEGEAARRALLSTYIRSAHHRGILWKLQDAVFFEMTQGNCHYCGKGPQEEPVTRAKSAMWYRKNKTQRSVSLLCFNGIDRIDSRGKYEIGNVVTCCSPCNHAKNVLSYDVFVKWINRIRGVQNA